MDLADFRIMLPNKHFSRIYPGLSRTNRVQTPVLVHLNEEQYPLFNFIYLFRQNVMNDNINHIYDTIDDSTLV